LISLQAKKDFTICVKPTEGLRILSCANGVYRESEYDG